MSESAPGVFEAYDPAMFASGEPLYAPFGSYVCNLAEPVTCNHCGHTQLVDWKHAFHVCDGILMSRWTRPEPMPSCPRCGEPKPITYRRNPEPGVPEETHWSEEPQAPALLPVYCQHSTPAHECRIPYCYSLSARSAERRRKEPLETK